jgi:uncharacterized membrane protein
MYGNHRGRKIIMQYQQRIITEPAANFRALARQGIQGRWGDAFLKGTLYFLMLNMPMIIIMCFTGIFDAQDAYMNTLTSDDLSDAEYMQAIQDSYSGVYNGSTMLSYIYALLVGSALMFGITTIYMRYRRRQEAPTDLLLSGFSNYSRALALNLLVGIFTALWTLLFIIPGIIAMYRYRLAFYILIDNPDIGPLEAIGISKKLMYGNKWQLFCLDLSFIGWFLLAGIAATIAAALFITPMMSGPMISASTYQIMMILTTAVLSITMGILYVYNGTAVSAFYERASGILKYTDEIPSNA